MHARQLLDVPNFFDQELARKIANGLENMLKEEEKLSWRYNTSTFVRRPCSCKYKYPGFDEERHKTVHFDEACDATTATVVEICRHLSDIAKVPSGKLPDVVVVNPYAEAASCIAWHSDDQPDFDAVENTAYIIGLSFRLPGKFLWRRKERQQEVEDGVVLEHGSGILMAIGPRRTSSSSSSSS